MLLHLSHSAAAMAVTVPPAISQSQGRSRERLHAPSVSKNQSEKLADATPPRPSPGCRRGDLFTVVRARSPGRQAIREDTTPCRERLPPGGIRRPFLHHHFRASRRLNKQAANCAADDVSPQPLSLRTVDNPPTAPNAKPRRPLRGRAEPPPLPINSDQRQNDDRDLVATISAVGCRKRKSARSLFATLARRCMAALSAIHRLKEQSCPFVRTERQRACSIQQRSTTIGNTRR